MLFSKHKLVLLIKKYGNVSPRNSSTLYRVLKPFEITNIRIRDIDLRPTNFNSVRSCSRKTSKLQASSRIVCTLVCVWADIRVDLPAQWRDFFHPRNDF